MKSVQMYDYSGVFATQLHYEIRTIIEQAATHSGIVNVVPGLTNTVYLAPSPRKA